MFRTFGGPEIALILGILVLIFGVGKLPQVGGSIGKAIKEFRRGVRTDDEEGATSEGSGSGRDEGVSKKRNNGN